MWVFSSSCSIMKFAEPVETSGSLLANEKRMPAKRISIILKSMTCVHQFFFCAMSIIILTGCSSQKKGQGQFKNKPEEKLNLGDHQSKDNTILFLTLSMAITDSVKDTYKFAVTNTIFAKGILNVNPFKNDVVIEPYNLYCEISDDKKKRVDLIKVQNPLLKVFEYSPDKEKLEKKLFISRTGELFLRFQFSKNAKYLTIYKPQADSRTLKMIYYVQI